MSHGGIYKETKVNINENEELNKTLYHICRWFSLVTPVSSANKTDRHDITEILLTVTYSTVKQYTYYIPDKPFNIFCMFSGDSCAAVYPCNETIEVSTPYDRRSLHACMFPCSATLCKAVLP